MTPQEFFAVVLPPPGHGYYCAAELTTKRKEHKFEEKYEDLQQTVDDWVAAKRSTYFALATFENPGSRTAANARHIRALFIDIDCNEDGPKTYGTKDEGFDAFNAFMAVTGLNELGQPYVIDSGGGYHVYWPLTETQTIEAWKPVAENFKRLFKQHGVKIDMTVTADAARVLRYPGTYNFKEAYGEPRLVSILQEGVVFDFETLDVHIRSKLQDAPAPAPTTNVIELAGARPSSAPSTTSVKLFENSVTRFKTILRATQAGSGCGQLEHYIEHAEEDGMEPMWRGMLSIAQKCEDGPKAVIWLSKLHPYTNERMEQKLREIKGPYPCIKFDSENPGICNKCSHWGKITNPLALGREVLLDTQAKEIEVEAPVESNVEPVAAIKRPEPPKGYAYGKHGGVFMEKVDHDAEGNEVKRPILLCAQTLYPIDILNNQGNHEVHFGVIRNKQVLKVLIPQKSIASRDETLKHLANQNVMASFGSGNDKNLYEYVRASVEKLSSERNPVLVPPSFGWQENGSFVYASKVYQEGKKPLLVPMPDLANVVNNTQPAGTLED